MTECQFLSPHQVGEVADTFERAFSDYLIKMRDFPSSWLMGRCKKNAVSWEHSVGVYDGGRMVGFTLLGLDAWKGGVAAFDAGTGLIPGYRGRGLGPAMLDWATPKLLGDGVIRLVLEVLQENEPAIRAYRKAGFEISREFECYELKKDLFASRLVASSDLDVRTISDAELDSFGPDLDWEPSWENSLRAIARIRDHTVALGAYEGRECVGMVVHYPVINWILSLVTRRSYRGKGIARGLLNHLLTEMAVPTSELRLNNVEATDMSMKSFLGKWGFEVYTRQYEMELVLRS